MSTFQFFAICVFCDSKLHTKSLFPCDAGKEWSRPQRAGLTDPCSGISCVCGSGRPFHPGDWSNSIQAANCFEKYVDSRVQDASVSLTLLEKKMRNVVSGRRKRMKHAEPRLRLAVEAAARDARDPSSVPVGWAFQAIVGYLEAVEDGQAPDPVAHDKLKYLRSVRFEKI